MRRIATTVLLLSAIVPDVIPIGAQQHPNAARGFHADKVYQLNGIDNINVYNGNLSLTIPLGDEYQGNGTLRYRLVLTYNSKNWDQEQYIYEDAAHPNVCGSNPKESEYCDRPYTLTVPSRSSNAGMGWSVSLGRLMNTNDPSRFPGSYVPPDPAAQYWVYEGPDGGMHAFTIADPNNDPNIPSKPIILYTRDGSNLRAMYKSTCSCYEVHFPDGMIHTFEPDPTNSNRTRIKQIADPYGNHLDVDYATTKTWTLKEYRGASTLVRTHYIRFGSPTDLNIGAPVNVHNDNYLLMVKEVDLAGFPQPSPVSTDRAKYTFQYSTDQIWYNFVPGHTSITCGGDVRPPETPDSVQVPRLHYVTRPDGSQWTMRYSELSTSCAAIDQLRLPTGGRIEWEYGGYTLPTLSCRTTLHPDGDFSDDFYAVTTGVTRRKVFADSTTSTSQDWTYAQTAGYTAQARCQSGVFINKEQQSTVTIQTPDHLKTEHYFSVWNNSRTTNTNSYFDISENGLPFTRLAGSNCDHPFSATELCLSTKTWDCTGSCTPVRATYVRYEGEKRPTGPDYEDMGYRREVETRTVFDDDPTQYVNTKRAQYDGLGHFRKITTTDSWTPFSKEEITNYNPTKPEIRVSDVNTWLNCWYTTGYSCPSNGIATNWLANDHAWVLNNFDQTSTTSYGNTVQTDYCFDENTGFLNRKRLRTGSDATRDILILYGGADGNVTSEAYFGGDATGKQLTTNFATCTGTPSSGAAGPSLTHTYGSVTGTRTATAFTGVHFKALDLTVDQNTGLPLTSKDTAQRATTFQYDLLGRITKLQPTGAAWTSYTYATTATPPSSAIVQQCDPTNTSTCTPLTEQRYFYDGLGRLVQNRTQLPTAWSVTKTTYDALDRPVTTSMPENASTGSGSYDATFTPAHVTTTTYDIFGRVTSVKTPDRGASNPANTTTTYAGIKATLRTRNIATGNSVVTKEEYDAAGQLRAITENCTASSDPKSPTCGATSVKTTYNYDAAGHLTCVGMDGNTTCGPGSRNRTFSYDGRGLLQSETHPENGTLNYTYDALGHALEKAATTSSAFDLTNVYDGAGRLTSVKQKTTGNIIKQFEYNDTANSNHLGMLTKAIRNNYDTPPGTTVTVTEDYTYGDAAGHLTQKDTTIHGITSTDRTVTQQYAYDALGNISDLTYPNLENYGNPSWGIIQPKYTKGLLTSIDARVNATTSAPSFTGQDITYAPNGAIATLMHSSNNNHNVVDTYTADDYGMSRVKSISFGSWSGGCTAPSITTGPQSSNGTSLSYNQTTTLSVVADGGGEFASYQWYSDTTPLANATSASYNLTATKTVTYRVRVATTCGALESNPITITVGLATPTSLQATRTGQTSIGVSWTAVAGATSYTPYRLENGTWSPRPAWPAGSCSSACAYADTVSADAAYAYYVVATGNSVTASGPSNKDIASTITVTAISQNLDIAFTHFDEIRYCLNKLRKAANANATDLQWTDLSAAPVAAPNGPIHAAHLIGLRHAMDDALKGIYGLTYTPPTYTDADVDLQNTYIKSQHLTELQQRVQ